MRETSNTPSVPMYRWLPGQRFSLRDKRWKVVSVNRHGRPKEIEELDGKHGIYFGDAAAWRGWWLGDWKYV